MSLKDIENSSPGIHIMSQKDDVYFLKSVALFEGLSDEQLARVVTIIRKESVSSGHIIIREDEEGDRMYIIQEGTVEVSRTLTLKVTKRSFGDREKTFIQLGVGFFFGEMALMENDVRSATVSALKDCTLFVIRHDAFNSFCEKHPDIGYIITRNIARTISARLRRTNQDILKLTTALSLALTH